MATLRSPSEHDDRIVLDPEILAGKPTVRGTRISVEVVLEFLERDLATDEIFEAFPKLTPDDVRACIIYARELVMKQRVKPAAPRRATLRSRRG